MTEYLPLGLEEIKADLKTFAKEQLGVTDTDYDGSNISVLVQLLAYNTLQLNRSMAFGFSEMFLSTAEIRRNVIRLARNNGYEPKRKTSYQYKIKLEANFTGELTLPQYSTFTAGDNVYTYIGKDLTKTFGDLINVTLLDDENSLNKTGQDIFSSLISKSSLVKGSYLVSDTGSIFEVLSKIDDLERKSLLLNVVEGAFDVYGGNTDLYILVGSEYKRIATLTAFTVDYTNYSEPIMYIFLDDLDTNIFPYITGDGTVNTVKFFTDDIKTGFVTGFEGFVVEHYYEDEGKIALKTSVNKLGDTECFNTIKTLKLTRLAKLDVLELLSLTIADGIATVSFSDMLEVPYSFGNGEKITVVGILDTDGNPIEGLNGLLEITDCTSTTLSWEYTDIPPAYRLLNAAIMDNSPTDYGHPKTFGKIKDIVNDRYIDIDVKQGNMLDEVSVEITQDILNLGYIPVSYNYNVEDDGFFVKVNRVNFNNIFESILWKRRQSFITDSIDKEERTYVVFQDEIYPELFKIHTKFADTGIKLSVGDIVNVKAIDSNGLAGSTDILMTSNNPNFTVVPYIESDTEVINQILLVRGQDEETTEEIRESSAMFANTSYRAVTKIDYQVICNKQPLVEQTQVWGGEELVPDKKRGNVYFSFIPYSRNTGFSNYNNFKFYLQGTTNKDLFQIPDTQIVESYEVPTSIFNVLKYYKVMTLNLVKINPLYLDFDVDVKIVYNNKGVVSSDLNLSIFNIILNYFRNSIEYFDSLFFYSNLMKYIDTETGDGTGISLTTSTKLDVSYLNFELIDNINIPNKYQLNFILNYPFSPIFEDNVETSGGTYYFGKILIDNLPNIRTSNFIKFEDEIYIDTTSIIGTRGDSETVASTYTDQGWFTTITDKNGNIFENYDNVNDLFINTQCTKIVMDIKYKINNNIKTIGSYTIYNLTDKKIIDLKINAYDGESSDGLLLSDFFDHKKLNLNFKTQDIGVVRNIFPRLNSVVFSSL